MSSRASLLKSAARIGEIGSHPTIGKTIPDRVLKIDVDCGLCKEIPFLGGRDKDKVGMVWWREIVSGARNEDNPTRSWLASHSRRPIIPRKGHNVIHNGLIGLRRNNRVGDAVTSWYWRRHLGENTEKSLEKSWMG